MPRTQIYLFTIYHHGTLEVREFYTSLDKALEEIKAWPWIWNQDDCSYALYQEVDLHEHGL